MKRIIKQDLSITLAVLAIAIFAFFFWMYPYHLFHKEQMMLFLYSGEFLRGYFQEEAWLACLTGDFLTQFFYYIGGGPFILSVVLTLFALLTYRTFRQFVSKRYALPLMILLVLWEAGRSCGLAYPLSATLSLIGAEGVFLLYSRSQTEGQRLLTCIPAMLLCYWCFGYGAWLCLALMLAAGIIDLARQGNIRAEELIKYQIPVEIAKEFADYTRIYEAKDTSLKEKYGKTYWFYYHFATTEPGKESKP